MILPYDANPCRMEFSERTGKIRERDVHLPMTGSSTRSCPVKDLEAGVVLALIRVLELRQTRRTMMASCDCGWL